MTIKVTVTDDETGDAETTEVADNYVLITAGTAHCQGVQVHFGKDGTQTHVITVRGCKP